jgi:uncharacterized protein involved in exopolysaccharide biosynthesis
MAAQLKVEREASLRDFLTIVFRRKWIVLTLFFLSSGTVLYLNLRTPVLYKSASKVLVRRGEKASEMSLQYIVQTWKEEIGSMVETAMSAAVIDRAQKALDDAAAAAAEPAVRIDHGGVSAWVVGESNVISIAYFTSEKKSARKVTDALTTAYIDFQRESREVPGFRDFFDSETKRLEDEIQTWGERRRAFKEERGIADYRSDRQWLEDQYRIRQNGFDIVSDDITEEEMRLAKLQEFQAQADVDVMDAEVFRDTENYDTFQDLRRELIRVTVVANEAAARYAPEHPERLAAESQVARLRELVQQELRNAAELSEARLSVLREKRKAISATIAYIQARLEKYPENEMEVEHMDEMLIAMRQAYKIIKNGEAEAKTFQASMVEWNVMLLTPASDPEAQKTRDYVRLAVAPIMSIIVGFGLAFFIDSVDHSLKSVQEVEEFLQVPVLASVNRVKRL